MEAFTGLQKEVTIGNVTLGGQPGQHPTVMVGTMFYKSHPVLLDKKAGIIDEKEALAELSAMEELARDTGVQLIVDVVGDSPANLVKFCTFVADATEDPSTPFLMDGLSDEIRLPAARELVEAGLANRLVYNSIEPKVTAESLNAIEAIGLKNAVLLAFDSRMLLPDSKLALVEGDDGLLSRARAAGIENAIVDVAVLDMPSIGIAARTIRLVKERTGLPAGCAPSNAVFECGGLKRFGKDGRNAALAGACSLLAANGADFILFGPVKHCKEPFIAVSTVDACNAYVMRRVDKVKPAAGPHPLKKMF